MAGVAIAMVEKIQTAIYAVVQANLVDMFKYVIFLWLLLITNLCYGANDPWYIGPQVGYGTTTWGHLVAIDNVELMQQTTPKAVSEGGVVYGGAIGYEFSPNFALEANYLHYPTARIRFNSESLFTFERGFSKFSSRTESLALFGKLMVYIPHTSIRLFSAAGLGAIYRHDFKHTVHLNPAFGAGLLCNLSQHLTEELGVQFYTGYGKTELEPVEDFVPFLYAAYARMAFRF